MAAKKSNPKLMIANKGKSGGGKKPMPFMKKSSGKGKKC